MHFATERKKGGSRRAFALIEEIFKDWEGKVTVITTGEQKNKAAVLETLFNIFQTVATNPQMLQDPQLARISRLYHVR